MNLHGLASGAIGSVNPFETISISSSTGSTINPDGSQTPRYVTSSRSAQVQQLSEAQLRQVESMNIQGLTRALYANGEIDAIIRMLNKGGDLITRADGTRWLVTAILEKWPDWCAVAVTQQDGS